MRAFGQWLDIAATIIVLALPVGLVLLYFRDKYVQKRHTILKTHPIIGRFRYVFEMLGPEFRQYGADLINVARGHEYDRLHQRAEVQYERVPDRRHEPQAGAEEGARHRGEAVPHGQLLATAREGVFMLAASCGLDSPVRFDRRHVTFKDRDAAAVRMDRVSPYPDDSRANPYLRDKQYRIR